MHGDVDAGDLGRDRRGAGADERGRAAHQPRRVPHAHEARRDDALAAGRDRLEIDLAVLGVDRGGEEPPVIVGDERGEECRQGRDADHRDPGGKPDRARRGDADAKPGVAPGADRHGDPVEARKSAGDVRDEAIEQRQQGLGMAALHDEGFLRQRLLRLRLHDAGRAGAERRIDGENAHAVS